MQKNETNQPFQWYDWSPKYFVMGHMTWPHSYQGQFVIRRLWLAHSIFTYIKFGVFAIAHYEDA